MKNEQLKQSALSSVEEHAALYCDLADRIWENPELSLKEFAAA